MRKISIIFFVLILWGCSNPHRPFYQDHLTPVPIKQSYISLQSYKNDTFLISKLGSAVIIRDGYAITSRHVVEGEKRIIGYMAGWVKFPITDIILSERFDLALLRIPMGTGEPAMIGEKIKKGEHIYSAGTTYKSTILEGIVRDTEFMIHHTDIDLPRPHGFDEEGRPITLGLIYQGDIEKGFSGGPIVNIKGELVGINEGYVIDFLGKTNEPWKDNSKSYGVGYHIADILEDINNMIEQLNNKGS